MISMAIWKYGEDVVNMFAFSLLMINSVVPLTAMCPSKIVSFNKTIHAP